MIDYLNIKEFISFKDESINFKNGLIVITGPSGSGKSLLMKSLLGVFGLEETTAKDIQIILKKELDFENYGIEKEKEYIFSKTTAKQTRYFINNKLITKKTIKEIGNKIITFLHTKEYSDFEQEKIVEILDKLSSIENKEHEKNLNNLREAKNEYKKELKRIENLKKIEKDLEEKKDFLEFEINKIKEVSPSKEEYEKLLEQKKTLSQQDKIKDKINKISILFDIESDIYKFMELIEEDSVEIIEAIERIRELIDKEQSNIEEMQYLNIEELLNKITNYSSLIKKYGNIENILKELNKKELELEELNNIEKTKELNEKKLKELLNKKTKLEEKVNKTREENIEKFKKKYIEYTNMLFLENIKVESYINKGEYFINIKINNSDIKNVSTGEFNRLRLGLLSLRTEYYEDTGILFLDEIDSNLSGEESMSIARLLKKLSKKYQIFTISHLPQLTSIADQHILIKKENNKSKIKELISNKDKSNEIARLISGEKITKEAIKFSENLLKDIKI